MASYLVLVVGIPPAVSLPLGAFYQVRILLTQFARIGSVKSSRCLFLFARCCSLLPAAEYLGTNNVAVAVDFVSTIAYNLRRRRVPRRTSYVSHVLVGLFLVLLRHVSSSRARAAT